MSVGEHDRRQDEARQVMQLAAEIKASWEQADDPYYAGPWEHLGDAERDARKLVTGVDALAAELAAVREERDRLRDALTEAWERIAAGDSDGAAEIIETALAGPLPCGHPASAVVGDAVEGTFYCGECARAGSSDMGGER